jgi:ATP-binding cassette subfamily F protein 3
VVEFRKVAKSYGDHQVFADVDFIVERGDRVALVGVNGAGKSTLIKILAGAEPISAGEFTQGHNVQPDYFAQDQYKELDPDAKLIDEMAGVTPTTPLVELRSLLGCFLFSEDDVFKKVGVLSGGERNRFALARLLVKPSNFLLLDEPTNHLDLRAKDVLLEALQGYTGTVVFVSHDRYFIDRLATRIFEVADQRITVFPGNYEDYLWRKTGGADVPPQAGAEPVPFAEVAPEPVPVKRVNPIKLRQLRDRAGTIEEEVERLEAEIAGYESALADFKSAEETIRIAALMEERRKRLTSLLGEWETVSAEIEGTS